MDTIQNKADAINELHTHINRIAPVLIKYIAGTTIKFKTNGDMFEKNRADIRAIIDADCPRRVRCFIEHNKHSGFSIKFDTNYQIGDCSCAYAGGWLSLAAFEPLKCDYARADFINAAREYDALREEARQLEGKAARIKSDFKL